MINPFKKTFTDREHNLFLFLSQIKLFSLLNYKEMALFIPHMHLRQYTKDEVVFFREDPSHALYLLTEGEVSLNIEIGDDFEHLTTVPAGFALGESCLLDDTKRQLNAFVTSEEAEFYVIPQDSIFRIFDGNPKIRTKMLQMLAEIYNNYNSRLFKSYKSSRGFFNLSQVYKSN